MTLPLDEDAIAKQLLADAVERRRQRIKSFYIEQRGMSEQAADAKATSDATPRKAGPR